MSKRVLLPLLLFSVLFSACSTYKSEPFPTPTTSNLPAVAIEFETVITKADKSESHYRWYFWRAENQVEIRNPQDNTSEVWTKLANGQVEYASVFHDAKQSIDYDAVDLDMIGETPDWTKITLLFGSDMMATLLSGSDETVLNQKAVHYKTNLPKTVFEVTWLPQQQVPAMIKREENGQTITTKIRALETTNKPMWSNPNAEAYYHTVFADIGDKESDPFIKSILHKLKGSHHEES